MRNSHRTAGLMILIGVVAPVFAERMGVLNLGGSSHFEYDSASRRLVQINNGVERIWETPGQGVLLQVEYSYEIPSSLDLEEFMARPERFPVGLTSEGEIYRGDPKMKSWKLIGQLPDLDSNRSGVSGDLFASHMLTEQLLFAASDTAVWYSDNLAKSWKKLGDLTDQPTRLVVSRDLDVVVFTKAGLAIEGKAEYTNDGRLSWTPAIEALPISADDKVFYAGPGQYTIVPASRTAMARTWRAKRGFEAAEAAPDKDTEFAARNATGDGCKWSVISRTPSRGWSNDNYWDFPWTRTEIDLEYQLLPGSSRTCTWQAPFRAARFEIRKSDNSSQVFEGGPGRYRFIAYENPSSEGVVRAFALHVNDERDYPKYGRQLKVQRGDLWAVLVQAGRGSRKTACQVFSEVQRQSAGGRSTLTIPVEGSNSGCPVARSTSIACVSQDARSAARSSRMSAFGVIQPMASGGSGECLLPDLP